jgi:large subunit ribosomal protein L10
VAELRQRLSEADASLRVVKNTLTERAADQAGAEDLKALLEGPTAFTFVRGDAALAAKAIATFHREHSVPEFKGGTMDGQLLSVEDLQAISLLPARDVLHGQLVGMLASPISGLVRGLNALIQGLALQLGQIAEQGLVTGEAPVAAEAPAAAEAPPADAEAAPAPEAPAEDAEAAPAAEQSPADEADEAPAPDAPAEEADAAPASEEAPAVEADAAPASEEAPAPAAEEAPAEEAAPAAEEAPATEEPAGPQDSGDAPAADETETPSEGDDEEKEG